MNATNEREDLVREFAGLTSEELDRRIKAEKLAEIISKRRVLDRQMKEVHTLIMKKSEAKNDTDKTLLAMFGLFVVLILAAMIIKAAS